MGISKYKKYTKAFSLYFGASLIPMVLSLVANPFIAMNMSPKDYAISGYYTAFSSLITPLIVFYMLHYYSKAYFECDENERANLKGTIANALIWFSGILSILCFFAILIYVKYDHDADSLPISPYLALTVFSIPATGLFTLLQTDLRMERNASLFFIVTILNGSLLIALNLLLIVGFKTGALGKCLAPLLTNLIFFIYSLHYYWNNIRLRFDWRLFKKIVKFCFPLTLAAMMLFFSNGYDRVYLEKIGCSTYELGFYVVGVSIAQYISVFQSTLSSTFKPDIFQAVVTKDNKKLLRVVGVLSISMVVISLTFILLAPLIVDVLTAGRYIASVKYARIVALSVIFSMLYNTISEITIAKGYSKLPLVNNIICSILSIICFAVLISRYQFIGAAWGLVATFAIKCLGNLTLIPIFKRFKHES